MGRSLTFDKQAALNQCLHAFWKNGFDNTSIRDLQKLTGLSGRSLIHSFGDKRQVFALCVEHYLSFVEQTIDAYKSESRGLQLFFESFIHCDPTDVRHNGCFLLNSMRGSLQGDPLLTEAFAAFTETLTDFFAIQLKLQGTESAHNQASLVFNLFLAGLLKISLSHNAHLMKEVYRQVQGLLDSKPHI